MIGLFVDRECADSAAGNYACRISAVFKAFRTPHGARRSSSPSPGNFTYKGIHLGPCLNALSPLSEESVSLWRLELDARRTLSADRDRPTARP